MQNNVKIKKQIAKLEKEKNKPNYKAYPVVLVIMIALVHLLDTYATDICTKVQSLYVNDFFVIGKGMTFESGLQKATIITTIGYVFTVIGPFYKALMDKIGRKPIFIINTAGMAVGMLFCWFSPNFIVFAIGQLCIVFFTMHDMQMLYIYEVAPSKWRSTLYFACKFIGVFGTIAIPLMREKFVQADGSGWRNVFIIPAVIGFVIFLMSALFMKESPIFIENRLNNLKNTEIEKENKKEIKTGIFPAIKYIFTHNQLKWLAVCIMVICTSMYAISMYYESYLSTVMTTQEVTGALYLQPIAMSVVYLSAGFISDKFGRKPASVVYSITAILGFVIFFILSEKNASPTAVGIMLGIYLGSFWNVTDLNGMMFSESAPTELRGSIMGTQALLLGVGTAVSLVLCMVLLSFIPLKTVMLSVGIPGLAIGSILTIAKLKETKGTDLTSVKYE